MALQIAAKARVFKFKNKGGTAVEIKDPNPDFSPADVLQFYCTQYPELTTATIDGPKVEGDNAVYEFKTQIGTKG